MNFQRLFLFSLLSLVAISACSKKEDDDVVNTNVNIPAVTVTCTNGSNASDCTVANGNKIWVSFADSNDESVAWAFVDFNCSSSPCTQTFSAWTDGTSTITKIPAGNYTVVAYADAVGNVTTIADISQLGSGDIVCTKTGAGITSVSSSSTTISLSSCSDIP